MLRLAPMLLVLLGAACASAGGRSTRLTHGDFNDTVQSMVESLAASDFLRDRTPDSPQIRIVTNKVLNLSSDVVTPAEQWMLIARVQGALPVQELAQQRNIVFQIPPEEIQMLRAKGFDATLKAQNAPTHIMTATIQSAVREVRGHRDRLVNRRKDYYLIEYTIAELAGGERVWSDRFELAREAAGLAID